MTKFKFAPLLFMLLLATAEPLFSQTKNPELLHWEALISRQLSYPKEARMAKKEGLVVISLATDSDSNLIEIKLVKNGGKHFDDQSLKAVENVRDLWTDNMIADRKPGEIYLLVFNYFFLQEGSTKQDQINSAMNLIQKGKPEKALKIAERMVSDNPYDATGLQLRSQIYRQLGQEEAATTDLIAYQEIQCKVLTQIDIKVYQMVSTQSVSGTIRY
ncbi:energy transducer TonB [Algoriphagus litoralis]|uniref:energy transducer TonB n=1 Tax=Algoriphagus litoralis TaxID=2202829 RepID=UPI0013009667|nr:energy transducer TonB [Algoriphagus litoralis]